MPNDTHLHGHYFRHPGGHPPPYYMPSMNHSSAFTHGMPGFAGFFTVLLFLLLIIFCLSMVIQRIRNTQLDSTFKQSDTQLDTTFRRSEPQIDRAPQAYEYGYQAVQKQQTDAPEEEYPHNWQEYEAPQASYPELPRQRL